MIHDLAVCSVFLESVFYFFQTVMKDELSWQRWDNSLYKWKVMSYNTPSNTCELVDLIIHFKLQPAEWWILTCCGISHHCSPSYIPAVCGHYNDFLGGWFLLLCSILCHDFCHGFFLFVSFPFLFVSFLLLLLCLSIPPPPSLYRLQNCSGA